MGGQEQGEQTAWDLRQTLCSIPKIHEQCLFSNTLLHSASQSVINNHTRGKAAYMYKSTMKTQFNNTHLHLIHHRIDSARQPLTFLSRINAVVQSDSASRKLQAYKLDVSPPRKKKQNK